jgi:dienelactone hydrolase
VAFAGQRRSWDDVAMLSCFRVHVARASFLVVTSTALAACDEPPPMPMPDAGGMTSSAALVFEPTAGAMDFGAIPFPDDLYRAEDGTIRIGELPGEAGSIAAAFFESLRTGLTEIDGFGASSPVFFPVRGGVDPTSLPADPAASVRDDASVFLVDVDPASPDAMTRIPAEVHWSPTRNLLSVRPADGHPLHEGRAYAAVVTRSVRGADGLSLSPAPSFVTVRDAAAEPTDPVLARAWRAYRSVLAGLAADGVATAEIVGLATFHVQTASDDLLDARAQLRARTAPTLTIERVASGADLDTLLGTPTEDLPGTDVMGGVQHTHIGWVVDGTFEAPSFQSAQPFVHDAWERRDGATFEEKRTDTVWFTLVLPQGDVSNVPVVVFQHGLGGESSQVFAIADTLAEAGYAVAAIDIPYHGMRARADAASLDASHGYGATPGPDLYGDVRGDAVYVEYLGVFDEEGPYEAFHPFYPRDALRQSVADLHALVDALERADWSSVTAASGGPTDLGFDEGPLGFVGVSLGGILGTMFVATEDRVGCAVLNVTGGHLVRLVEQSASFNGTFLPILFPKVGLAIEETDYEREPPVTYPQLALYQTLLDRGDSMTLAPRLAERGVHVLFQMAIDDETVPNVGTEALARASGATIADADPRHVDLVRVASPVRPSLDVGGTTWMRTLTTFTPASHGLILSVRGSASVEHPPAPPFVERTSPTPIENPIVDAQAQIVRLFASWRGGMPEVR